jgi:hypothetical protein
MDTEKYVGSFRAECQGLDQNIVGEVLLCCRMTSSALAVGMVVADPNESPGDHRT